MENNTKNILILSGAAIAGGWGGSWATGRLGTAMGLALGPWGAAAGVVVGAILGTALAKKMLGDSHELADLEAMANTVSEQTKG